MRLATATALTAILTVLACGCASAQKAPDAEDRARASAREPYRGHAPFAVAILEPFNDSEWFIASFFHYWTGFTSDNSAEEHWLVRLVSGQRDHWDDEHEREIPATPTTTRWATSDTCSDFEDAIARFDLHERAMFEGGAQPSSQQDAVVISTLDTTYLSFWGRLRARHSGIEISMYAPYFGDSGVAHSIREIRSTIEGCLSDVAPAIPASPLGPTEPLDIFE